MAAVKENDYYVTLGVVYKKPGTDPETQKMIKLNRKVGHVVHTTGKIWKGAGGGFWVELNTADGDSGAGEKPGYVMIDANGFGTPGPCLQKADPDAGPPILLKAKAPEGSKPWDGGSTEKEFIVLAKTPLSEVKIVLTMLFGLKSEAVKFPGKKDDATAADCGFAEGTEVEFEYSDGKPMTLIVMSPVEAGEKLLDLSIRDNWNIGQVAGLIAQSTGLKKQSMIMAKGKMGERVPESAKLDDKQLVVDQGYSDGDEIAFMYLGNLEGDLEKFLASKK
mmetsp:Transcript_122163/g.346300  ORF Transcript_122163/g.346300 Transcript_122163/m.346300 type:complete len:277 (-) Transcript_122163:62-892(-)